MELLNQILKVNLFQKILNKQRLTAKEFTSLILILFEKDIAFNIAFTPKTNRSFPVFELTLVFSPDLEISFKIKICE
ncbi:hypothetical protein MWH28_10450 [Natroniella sulfidigena]|uniref:hypothetical protein n=1 Tax=Natroniella sulfidigena TaxID=723921 RepID=UPI002009E36B|nr:hypothetical protein [Natroniella sulfidigena]MCK8817781.1 hypothetical protein [Natroniella sulfidigena]